MRLDSAAVEYVHLPLTVDATFTSPPDISWDGNTFGATSWAEPSWRNIGTILTDDGRQVTGYQRIARQLVAGPAAANPGTALVLPNGTHRARVRVSDNPEQPVRAAREQLIVGALI